LNNIHIVNTWYSQKISVKVQKYSSFYMSRGVLSFCLQNEVHHHMHCLLLLLLILCPLLQAFRRHPCVVTVKNCLLAIPSFRFSRRKCLLILSCRLSR